MPLSCYSTTPHGQCRWNTIYRRQPMTTVSNAEKAAWQGIEDAHCITRTDTTNNG